MIRQLLSSKTHNPLYLNRYFDFIESRTTLEEKYKTQKHHVLPKAKDFFPEYSKFSEYPWNCCHLTHREHFIAHMLLHKAFPNTSQSIAFYYMSNIAGKTTSKVYEQSRTFHISKLIETTKCPIRRAKISKALSGKPKSHEHIQSMVGHTVTPETRQKLMEINLGKTHTTETREQMSKTRTGKTKKSFDRISKRNIASSKMVFKIKTPSGNYSTFSDWSDVSSVPISTLKNIFRGCNLDKIPREKSLSVFNMSNPNKVTWKELGFDKIT